MCAPRQALEGRACFERSSLTATGAPSLPLGCTSRSRVRRLVSPDPPGPTTPLTQRPLIILAVALPSLRLAGPASGWYMKGRRVSQEVNHLSQLDRLHLERGQRVRHSVVGLHALRSLCTGNAYCTHVRTRKKSTHKYNKHIVDGGNQKLSFL